VTIPQSSVVSDNDGCLQPPPANTGTTAKNATRHRTLIPAIRARNRHVIKDWPLEFKESVLETTNQGAPRRIQRTSMIGCGRSAAGREQRARTRTGSGQRGTAGNGGGPGRHSGRAGRSHADTSNKHPGFADWLRPTAPREQNGWRLDRMRGKATARQLLHEAHRTFPAESAIPLVGQCTIGEKAGDRKGLGGSFIGRFRGHRCRPGRHESWCTQWWRSQFFSYLPRASSWSGWPPFCGTLPGQRMFFGSASGRTGWWACLSCGSVPGCQRCGCYVSPAGIGVHAQDPFDDLHRFWQRFPSFMLSSRTSWSSMA